MSSRTNRLIHETSPYLLQHAHNPVDWYPWGPEALARARAEDRPIFLSIGYSACHWCHVMERESFEDEETARLLNESFVPVKVDREERPDLDEIYMTATQLFSGSGGWPMSVFLTPDLQPFFAGTYFPPEDRFGRPGFKTVLRALAKVWRERRDDVLRQAEELTRAVREVLAAKSAPARLDTERIARAVDSFRRDFDAVHGGFGGAPKFPPHGRLALILREYRRRPLPEIGGMAEITLDRMARGGIYDHIGGGFARYSVDERWLVPHFEKMLYDNAQLAPLYVEAAQAFGRADFRRVAIQTLDFWLREMTHPEGGFFSALDADSEGEEGKYYLWTPAEVIEALGEEDGRLFCRAFDITQAGNFEHRSIPNLLGAGWGDLARLEGMSEADFVARVDRMLLTLREVRSRRVPPARDEKILTAWNGLMIRALAIAGRELPEPRYVAAAARAAEFLLHHLRREGRLLVTWRDGEAKLPGYLDDYAFLAVGLLELHAATGEGRWLDEARALVDQLDAHFWDEEGGGYFFTADDHETLIVRAKRPQDGATPSGMAFAAWALTRLATLTGDLSYRARAERTLTAYAEQIERYPSAFAWMLWAADEFLATGPPSSNSTLRVRAWAEAQPPQIRPGESARILVHLEVDPGWHLYAAEAPGVAGVPTAIAVGQGYGITAGEGEFPLGEEKPLGAGGSPVRVYEGSTTLAVSMNVAADTEPRRYGIPVRVRYQACSESECLPPAEEQLQVELEVTPPDGPLPAR